MSKDFDYEEFVIECYNDKKDQEIHNASEENALLLFNKLFEKAIRDKEDVKIISNQLLKRFYNQLTDKLQQVLKNGNTVSVIVEKEIDDKEHNTFYQQSEGNLKIASNFDELPNFIVVGNNAFRYETDKNSTKAIANFNHESMGAFISNLFDKINNDILPA
ncbi:hypothetical protein [bacterium endosymbiont of Bathymodiolus sp. 5 South]|uniref:hypothetical protein n=1 Tax=bacterium endosymbiont of Bathymodiolus sp. 5 South TaxID=1181670 RepID=UPI0010B0EE27|nr:hypothetical protein [bacterium endosymbiont of Bathymodiolus sp. 5 South]SSC08277.1 hypothetical protein BTURTLESOX_423 [bacterium endosymbiont of Bathymodiolus sp. 5 South]